MNQKKISKLIIDSHYEIRHKDSVNDKIIQALVEQLDGAEELPSSYDKEGFEYYVKDHMRLKDKVSKIIWLLHPEEDFIGIVNVYRRK